MLRLVVVLAAMSAAVSTGSIASYHEGRGGHGRYDMTPRSAAYGDEANPYAGYSDREGKQTEQGWRGFPFDDGDDGDDNGDFEDWGESHKKNKHGRHGDEDDKRHGQSKGDHGEGRGHGDGHGDGDDEGDGRGFYGPDGDKPSKDVPHGGRGDDEGYGYGPDDHHGHTDGEDPSRDPDGRADPMKQVRSGLQIRQDTEGFTSAVLAWVNDLVTPEVASTLVVDTTFSLTKSEDANVQTGSGTSSGLQQLFAVVLKFVNSPQDVNLVEEDIQALGWAALIGSDGSPRGIELEGGIYAAFQITCDQLVVLNVSISSSGSTPTIQGQPVENSGLYVDVSILDGTIQATDAQGSVIGLIKHRHYPENTDVVLKTWTTTVQGCAAAKTLAVTGAVGGGWTEYKTDNSTTGSYEDFAIGYSESFTFSFPEVASLPPVDPAAPPGTLHTNAVLPAITPPADVAGLTAAAYVQSGISCGQSPAAHKLSCGGLAVMSQLQSFHHYATISSTKMEHATQLQATPTEYVGGAVYVAIVGGVVLAVAAVAMLTQRRRNGYHGLQTNA